MFLAELFECSIFDFFLDPGRLKHEFLRFLIVHNNFVEHSHFEGVEQLIHLWIEKGDTGIMITLGWQVCLLMEDVPLDPVCMILHVVCPINFANIEVENACVTTLLKLAT